jgi:hypothetical protein
MTAIKEAPVAPPRVPTRAAPNNPLIGLAVGVTDEHKADIEQEIVAAEDYLGRLRATANMFGANPFPRGEEAQVALPPVPPPAAESMTIEAEAEPEEPEEDEKPKARNPRAEYRGRKPGRKPLPRDGDGNIVRPEKPAVVIPPASTKVEIDDDDDDDDDQVPPPKPDRKSEVAANAKRKEEANRLPPQAQAKLDVADGKAAPEVDDDGNPVKPDDALVLRQEIAKYIWRRGMAGGGDIMKDVPGVGPRNVTRLLLHPWFEVGDKINKRWSLTIKGKNEALEGY